MADAASVKLRLRSFERSFAAQHGRAPTSRDLTDETRDLYALYKALKRGQLAPTAENCPLQAMSAPTASAAAAARRESPRKRAQPCVPPPSRAAARPADAAAPEEHEPPDAAITSADAAITYPDAAITSDNHMAGCSAGGSACSAGGSACSAGGSACSAGGTSCSAGGTTRGELQSVQMPLETLPPPPPPPPQPQQPPPQLGHSLHSRPRKPSPAPRSAQPPGRPLAPPLEQLPWETKLPWQRAGANTSDAFSRFASTKVVAAAGRCLPTRPLGGGPLARSRSGGLSGSLLQQGGLIHKGGASLREQIMSRLEGTDRRIEPPPKEETAVLCSQEKGCLCLEPGLRCGFFWKQLSQYEEQREVQVLIQPHSPHSPHPIRHTPIATPICHTHLPHPFCPYATRPVFPIYHPHLFFAGESKSQRRDAQIARALGGGS